MNLTLIAAISDNDVIGINGKLPWNISEDMKKFRELTIGHPVIMGRKTYESIPKGFRPLPKRKNIVLSKSLIYQGGIYVAGSVYEALSLTDGEDTYVMGGEKIYESFLPFADKMEITKVHGNFAGDLFFPKVNWDEWNLIREEEKTSKNEEIPYSFLTYTRK